mmetsp:Transcript_25430/g.73414  ORF Transcript_25430/g.73414 Transcript_25430/m.73414 type:complete len:201 (-) Transcript_25430:589-1191(-)
MGLLQRDAVAEAVPRERESAEHGRHGRSGAALRRIALRRSFVLPKGADGESGEGHVLQRAAEHVVEQGRTMVQALVRRRPEDGRRGRLGRAGAERLKVRRLSGLGGPLAAQRLHQRAPGPTATSASVDRRIRGLARQPLDARLPKLGRLLGWRGPRGGRRELLGRRRPRTLEEAAEGGVEVVGHSEAVFLEQPVHLGLRR